MSATSTHSIQVRVETGGLRARIIIPAGHPPEAVTSQFLADEAKKAGVVATPEVEARLTEIARNFHSSPADVSLIFAEAKPAVGGEDGRIEWIDGFNPQATPARLSAGDVEGQVDHYAGFQHVGVKAGQCVARVFPATDGVEGVNVLGHPIRPRPGKSCTVKFDKTLSVNDEGLVSANVAGMLRLENGLVRVIQALEIAGDVDFSTGSINCQGAVHVRGGVKDRFTVKATGSLTIDGLVQGAHIHCGGDLTLPRGMAARDHGHIVVAGNAHIGFLNNVKGQVNGHLLVRRELMNCELFVGGDFLCEQAAVIGGRIMITGSGQVGALGSLGHVSTTLHLGEVPLLRLQLRKLDQIVRRLTAELRAGQKDSHSLPAPRARSANERDTPAQPNPMLESIESRLAACETKRGEITQAIFKARTVNLLVLKMVHPKVTLKAGECEVVFENPMKGPVRFLWNDRHDLQFRVGEGPVRPIGDIARIVRLAA